MRSANSSIRVFIVGLCTSLSLEDDDFYERLGRSATRREEVAPPALACSPCVHAGCQVRISPSDPDDLLRRFASPCYWPAQSSRGVRRSPRWYSACSCVTTPPATPAAAPEATA